MAFPRFSALTAVVSVLVVLTGCATTGSGLRTSAERLERNADALARDSRAYDSSNGYSHDARELAGEAHDFSRTVNDSRADKLDVNAAFEQLSRRYHALRDEVDRSSNRDAEHDLRPVTEAYLDVERAIGGYHPDSRRYARDRDGYDR
jgi:hypothetical protein